MDETRPTANTARGVARLLPLRRWGWGGFVFFWGMVSVSTTVAYLHYTSPPPDISHACFQKIRLGMTEEETERTVGARPGGYGLFWAPGETLEESSGVPVRWARWNNQHGILSVGYDTDGRVCYKELEHQKGRLPAESPPRLWWQRLTHRSVPSRTPMIGYFHF